MPDDFFEQQQKIAVRAMGNCCKEAWQAIEHDTDIKPTIRRRPFASLGVAAAAGLIAGYMVAGPRRPQPKKQPPGQGKRQDDAKPEHRGFLVKLEEELAHAIGPVLRTFAMSSAGAMFADVHHGFTNGQSPNNGHAHHDTSPPPPAMQF